MTIQEIETQRMEAIQMAERQAKKRAVDAALVRAGLCLSDSVIPYDAKQEVPIYKSQRTGGDFCGGN